MRYGIVFFGAGLLVGAAVGYLGAGAKYKRLLAEQQAEEEFEDEDEDDDKDDSNKDLTEDMIQEKRRSDDKLIRSHMDHYTAYDKIAEENTRKANAEEKLQEAEETGINHAPYRITLNDFDEGTAGFNQERLSYFIKDDILMDEMGDMTDVVALIGYNLLHDFVDNKDGKGYRDGTNDTFYVRNESKKTDFEVEVIDDYYDDNNNPSYNPDTGYSASDDEDEE